MFIDYSKFKLCHKQISAVDDMPKNKYVLNLISINNFFHIGLNTHHDVIFVGTTRGRVLKLVNSARHGSDMEPLPVLVEALQVLYNKYNTQKIICL